jgi:amidohydrolase
VPIIPRVQDFQDELVAIRRDLHANPELGFEEFRTSEIVAQKLAEYGCEVHRGLGKTGVVGTLRNGNAMKAIGFRADMDALPMPEENEFGHRSTVPGKMHACGHDGHTTMLLGAAKYLAETRNFEGAVHFIFQPAEEGKGGGRVMVEEGLFEQFPCDAVFAVHNKPDLPVGHIVTNAGPLLAASDRFEITARGRGSHAAQPHRAIDPFVMASQVVLALQTIASRNIDPMQQVVVTVGFMRGGSAHNVIPDSVVIGGTVRTFSRDVQDLVERRMREIAQGVATTNGGEAEVVYSRGYPPTVNDPAQALFAAEAAAEICGKDSVKADVQPIMGAEDFSYMLNARPGAMLWLGNGDTPYVHTTKYDFNDEAIPYGVSFFSRLAERFLEKEET